MTKAQIKAVIAKAGDNPVRLIGEENNLYQVNTPHHYIVEDGDLFIHIQKNADAGEKDQDQIDSPWIFEYFDPEDIRSVHIFYKKNEILSKIGTLSGSLGAVNDATMKKEISEDPIMDVQNPAGYGKKLPEDVLFGSGPSVFLEKD